MYLVKEYLPEMARPAKKASCCHGLQELCSRCHHSRQATYLNRMECGQASDIEGLDWPFEILPKGPRILTAKAQVLNHGVRPQAGFE